MLEKDSIGSWIQSTNSSSRLRRSSNSNLILQQQQQQQFNSTNNSNNKSNSLLLLESEEIELTSNLKRIKTNNNNNSNIYYEEERIEYQDAFSFEGYSALANSLGLLHLVQSNSMDSENSTEEDYSNSSRSHNSSYSTLSYTESITTPPTNSVTASPQLLPILNLQDLPKFDLLEFTTSSNLKPPSLTSPLLSNRRKTLDLPNNLDSNVSLYGQSNISSCSNSTSFSFPTFEYSNPSIDCRAPQSTPVKSIRPLMSPTSLLWRSNLPSSYVEITPQSSSSTLSHPEITSTMTGVNQFQSLPATKRRRI